MQNNSSSDDLKKSTTLGWKFVAIVAVITAIFFTFLYLAMTSKPDYMQNRPAKSVAKNEVTNSASQTDTESASSINSQ